MTIRKDIPTHPAVLEVLAGRLKDELEQLHVDYAELLHDNLALLDRIAELELERSSWDL